MFSLTDIDTARVLRALSLTGPASAETLAIRLHLRDHRIRAILAGALEAGVVHASSDSATAYRVDALALAALVRQHCDELIGAAA